MPLKQQNTEKKKQLSLEADIQSVLFSNAESR